MLCCKPLVLLCSGHFAKEKNASGSWFLKYLIGLILMHSTMRLCIVFCARRRLADELGNFLFIHIPQVKIQNPEPGFLSLHSGGFATKSPPDRQILSHTFNPEAPEKTARRHALIEHGWHQARVEHNWAWALEKPLERRHAVDRQQSGSAASTSPAADLHWRHGCWNRATWKNVPKPGWSLFCLRRERQQAEKEEVQVEDWPLPVVSRWDFNFLFFDFFKCCTDEWRWCKLSESTKCKL